MEDETALSASLDTYRFQLSQVESTLEVASDDMKNDLLQLQTDLKQLIQLTEESLLSVKKSRLLASLNSSNELVLEQTASNSTGDSSAVCDLDAEFAAFQQAIAEDVQDKDAGIQSSMAPPVSGCSRESVNDETEEDDPVDEEESDSDAEDSEVDISGTKCRAPYSHSWGELTYHNAVILCALPDQSQVRVLYCNPTHNSMRPCPYFLEGNCRYDDLHCRFSHGELVSVDDLKPFLEPDYSDIHLGSECLAHDTDDIWYRATIVEIFGDNRFHVMFEANQQEAKLDAQDVFPLVSSEDKSKVDSDRVEDPDNMEASDGIGDEDELPVYLWRPGQTTDVLGQWEQHTRGIGSKIMAKMGYIVGQGLGKNSEGRSEPVPIQLLPQGKSLDKIMELKQLAGDRDIFDALRKMKRRQKIVDSNAVKTYTAAGKAPANSRVFDFINHKLDGHKSGTAKGLTRHSSGTKKHIAVQQITAHDLEKKSNKHLNIQLCKTHEEMKNAKREITRLRIALERNERQDQVMAKQIRAKLSSMEDYVAQLQTSEAFIKQHQTARQARDVLCKF